MRPTKSCVSHNLSKPILQHLQTTDAHNFDVHVEEYIIQEHNDDQISSDGTVAWVRNIRQLHHIAALLTQPIPNHTRAAPT